LKISFENDIRRASLQPEQEVENNVSKVSFQRLKDTIRSMYVSLRNSVTFEIRYQDEEGDWITLSSDEELCEAVSIHISQSKPVLRLKISHHAPLTEVPNKKENATNGNLAKCQNPKGNSISESSGCLHGTILEANKTTNKHIANLDSYCGIWSKQNDALCKPSADALQKQIKCLKKISEPRQCTLRHVNALTDTWIRGQNLMLSKSPEKVKEACALLKTLLVMDDERHSGACFDIARCETFLGNFPEAILYLSKAVYGCNLDPVLIEENPDFAPLRHLEAFQTLITSLKTSSLGFYHYYLSTLQCVGASKKSQEKDKYKWPISEAEKANTN